MKVQIISAIKKISAMLIASLMILGIIPIGLLALPTTVNAEDEFLRLLPDREACSSVIEQAMEQPEDGVFCAGVNADGYMRFDIRTLLGRDIENLHQAKLRFTVMRGNEKAPLVRIWLMQDNNWNDNINLQGVSSLGDVIISEVVPKRSNYAEAVVELDLTDYVKKWIKDEREYVSFRIDALDGTVQYAGTSHQDPAFRPCLKVVTGAAVDPDSSYLSKSALHSAAVDGKRNTETYHIPDGQSLYLNFAINKNNINGAIYQSYLRLALIDSTLDTTLKIYQIENTDWASNDVANQTPPEGREHLIYTFDNLNKSSLSKIDMTDIVNDSIKLGASKIGFRIFVQNGDITLSGGNNHPHLDISVSDKEDIVAVTEASVNCLGKNPDIYSITQNLPDEYFAKNGKQADIRWSAFDTETGEELKDILTDHGEIERPHWFRDSKTVLAIAKISSGSYIKERGFYLTILPNDAPDYGEVTFDNALTPGNSKDENQHMFESLNTQSHSRYIGGHIFEYRELKTDGTMVLNLATNREAKNFITLKLWGADAFFGFKIKNLNDLSAEPLIIEPTNSQFKIQDGFVYLTYPLPLDYTNGKDYVSLKLEGLMADDGSNLSQYIYGVYVSDTPYFDPLSFAEQGETLIKRLNQNQSFQQRLKALAKKPLMFFRKTNSEAGDDIYTVDIDGNHSVLINTSDENMAVSIPLSGIAEINRENSFYSSYSKTDIASYGDISVVDYGKYQIFRNVGEEELSLPYTETTLSGIYQNLITEEYYSFLGNGEMPDISVLPKGTEIKDSADLTIKPDETIIFALVSKPLYYADWRVSQINNCPISKLSLADEITISSLTIRNLGYSIDEEGLDIICNVYERGILVGMEKLRIIPYLDRNEFTVNLKNNLKLTPGQTLKIFIVDSGEEPHKMTPKLELP